MKNHLPRIIGIILLLPAPVIADNFWECLIEERESISSVTKAQIVVDLCKERYPLSYKVEECSESAEKKRGKYAEFFDSLESDYLTIDKPLPRKEVCPKKTLILPDPISPWPWEPQTKNECQFEYSKGLTSEAALKLVSRSCEILYRKLSEPSE